MSRLCLYYRTEPERDRWVPGDRRLRPVLRRLVRGAPRLSGVDLVFHNLCLGLDRLGVRYEVNLPFRELEADDRVGVLGRGRHCLAGYDRPNPIVAGVALMTHPSEWPTLCDDHPIARYLQHSTWAADVYRPYFGDRVAIWAVGIDTERWAPGPGVKQYDFVVYDKIRWNRDTAGAALLATIRASLEARNLSWTEIVYGSYSEAQFKASLDASAGMIFLSGHESQGLACGQCLSSGVPVLAWDPGECLDPHRFAWGQAHIPATSVPYFDERCGERFSGPANFDEALDTFVERQRRGSFAPRDYILEQLTLEACARRYVGLFEDAGTAR